MTAVEQTAPDHVEALLALRDKIRAAWDPSMDADALARLQALETEVHELLEEASIQAQRSRQATEATVAAMRRIPRWFVHPGGHFGPCPNPRSYLMSEAELRPVAAAGIWHLDPGQEQPDWFPILAAVDAPLEV